MFVYKDKKAVILAPKDPTKYTTLVKSAKPFIYKGKKLLAVPHRPDETNQLRELGLNVPAPMNMYYKYQGMFSPFEVQRKTAEFASMNKRCFILNSMGLGKTVTALWAADYLRSVKEVHRVLVICPISVMDRTWADEVFRTFTEAKVNVLYGTREKRLKLLKEEADYYVINTDGIKIIKDALENRPDIDLIIIDEVALFRNHTADRWKAANVVCNKQLNGTRRVWGLTGSPIPNCPTDAFGQIKLVTPANPDCPRYFGGFRNMLMLQVSKFKWIAKDNAIDTVFRIMQPAIRFALDDAVDLPPQIVTKRTVELSEEQKKAYKDMYLHLRSEVESGEVTAVNEAVKAGKLLQICCGVAYNREGEEVTVKCDSRLEVLDEVVNESTAKTIVFVPFTGALRMVSEFLLSRGHTTEVVDGSTKKDERDRIFYDFQHSDNPRVIVANPGTMSHGLTLVAATTICWYGPTYNNEVYQQACARVRRPGQKHTTVIVQLVSSKLEEQVYDRIDKKQTTQGLLLDLVRCSNNLP